MKARILIAIIIMLQGFSTVTKAQDIPQGLGSLLHNVEEKSPDLSAAKARFKSAKAAVNIVKSRYFGQAALSAQDSHFKNERPINQTLPPVTDDNQINYGVAFNVPIDINGRITAQYNAQIHLSNSKVYDAENMRLILFKQTANFYRGLQKLDGMRDALSEQKKALEGHRNLTKAAIDAGRVAKVELLRIKAEISDVEGKLAALQGDEQALRAGIAALLDQEYFDDPVVPVLVMKQPSGFEDDKDKDKVLPSRPDVLAADSSEKAGHERLKDAQREWLPELSVQAAAGREKGYDTDSSSSASITGRLSWELWDGGRRIASTDKAAADLNSAKEAKRAIQNRARSEITANKASWRARSAAYNAAKTGLEAAEETARIEGDLYKNGRVSAVDLIDVEAALAQARSNLTSSMADWWLADDQLNIAMGRPPSSYNTE